MPSMHVSTTPRESTFSRVARTGRSASGTQRSGIASKHTRLMAGRSLTWQCPPRMESLRAVEETRLCFSGMCFLVQLFVGFLVIHRYGGESFRGRFFSKQII